MDVAHRLAEEFLAKIEMQLAACDDLESVSDELPQSNTHALLLASERLCPLLSQSHCFEEARIHPLVVEARPELRQVLARLRDEHIEDQDQAGLLLDNVRMFVTGTGGANATEVGYVARGLFTSLRRHLAFDQQIIEPIVRGFVGSSFS